MAIRGSGRRQNGCAVAHSYEVYEYCIAHGDWVPTWLLGVRLLTYNTVVDSSVCGKHIEIM